jgi:signal transduction histidine kinase
MPSEIAPLVAAVNGALDRLERGFRAQREFTADAAHELRTPLAILRAHVDTIEDKQLADSLREDIDAMSRLVAQLLELTEIDTLTISSDEIADLNAMCMRTVTSLHPLAAAEGKQVELETPPKPVLVFGNQDMLGRAVRNLLENAIRHTAAGTCVAIRLTGEPGIHVTDRGPGIPVSERELVFQRFWRRDRRRAGSAGLGLSIVSRIVAAHGGKISIGDNPGGGAVFTIKFPAHSHVDVEASAAEGAVWPNAADRRLRHDPAATRSNSSVPQVQ